MSIRVGINGFGRIGRNVLRAALDDESIEFAAVNDITDPGTLAHLLQYDSVLGNLSEPVSVEGNRMQVGRRSFAVLSERDPGALPWRDLGVDVVVESTGLFTKRDDAGKHLAAGAKRVIITAPAKGPDLTLVLGVNDDSYDPAAHRIISNASCTTNCLAPVAKVLHDSFGFRRGWMTTVHAYTNDQRLLDLPHKDLRRARAAAVSMIPTTTGAAAAVGQVLPALKGRLDGIAMRVPTPNVSVVDLVAEVERTASAETVNAAFAEAAAGRLSGILQLSTKPLVSIDFRGNPHSSIVDADYTRVMDGNLVKILSWYDNEWAIRRAASTSSGFSPRRAVNLRGGQVLDSAARSGGQARSDSRRLQRAAPRRRGRRRHPHPCRSAHHPPRARTRRDRGAGLPPRTAQGRTAA